MAGLVIHINFTKATTQYWSTLPDKLRNAIVARFEMLSVALEAKVHENLTGKILQERSGKLLESIQRETDISGLYGFGGRLRTWIGPRPASPKAWALERGGKSSYPIFVGWKGVLANPGRYGEEPFFSTKDVMHPPSKEFGYLAKALAEMHDPFVQGMAEVVGDVK